MSRRRRSTMSEQLKNELAKDLGFYDTVQREGWGAIKAKDAGNMVKRAIQIAEQAAAKQYQAQQGANVSPAAHRQPVQRVQQQQQPEPVATTMAPTSYGAIGTAYGVPQGYVPVARGNASQGNRQTTAGAAAGAAAIPPYMQQAMNNASQPPTSQLHQ